MIFFSLDSRFQKVTRTTIVIALMQRRKFNNEIPESTLPQPKIHRKSSDAAKQQ